MKRQSVRISSGPLAALFASLSFIASPAPAADVPPAEQRQSPAGLSAARLQLRWELLRNEFRDGRGHSLGRLSLTNHNVVALPAAGWALYFTTMDPLRLGALANDVVLEQVGGELFRVVPGPKFQGLPPGQTLHIDYHHPGVVAKLSKAPTGPYLVFDAASETGLPIGDYRQAVMQRPEQLDKGPADPISVITAAAVYEKNQAIEDIPAGALPPVFPTPQRVDARAGQLQWRQMPRVIASDDLRGEAAFASDLLRPYFPAAAAAGPAAPLRLLTGSIQGQRSPEAYELTVDPEAGITLKGQTAAGVMRGLASLRDLLPERPHANQAVTMAALHVSDAPRFDYRGFQLDVARNFHPKQTIFRLLDLMARFKLNKFHFHLTDDEGWRLEIADLPELTEVGARRGHTLSPVKAHLQPAYGSGPDVANTSGSGHYTRADYVEILRYAAARHIEVIPEIEMPGHARAAVIAMQSRYHRLMKSDPVEAARYLLHDFDDQSQYVSPQLYTDHVMNPGVPSVYTFIDKVVAEVAALHREAGAPLRTLHVGGDELPDGAWERSPASARLMQQRQLPSTADLWDHFYERVDEILRKHGLRASGWEELGARKVRLNGKPRLIPNPHFTRSDFSLYVWNNIHGAEDLGYRLANAGYPVVLAPVTRLYFDMAYNKNPEEPGVNWGGYVDTDTVFDFVPFDDLKGTRHSQGKDGLTDYGQRRILGLEATLFTETVQDEERLDYLVMPRLLALAERAWASNPAWATEADARRASALHRTAWSTFAHLLGQRVLPRLDADRPNLRYRIPPPGLQRQEGAVLVNHQFPGMVLRYTNDGSLPTGTSKQVLGPLPAKGQLRVAAFDRNGRSGLVSGLDNP